MKKHLAFFTQGPAAAALTDTFLFWYYMKLLTVHIMKVHKCEVVKTEFNTNLYMASNVSFIIVKKTTIAYLKRHLKHIVCVFFKL